MMNFAQTMRAAATVKSASGATMHGFLPPRERSRQAACEGLVQRFDDGAGEGSFIRKMAGSLGIARMSPCHRGSFMTPPVCNHVKTASIRMLSMRPRGHCSNPLAALLQNLSAAVNYPLREWSSAV